MVLNINNIDSANAAESYYGAADYYGYGQAKDAVGDWHGLAAERLGLRGPVDLLMLKRVLGNRDPFTGRKLADSRGRRRAGVDFTFSAPKSLSVLHALTNDERLVEAMREAVRETMADIEKEVMARVRVARQSHDRVTGNWVWAEFIHFTSRAAKEEEGKGAAANDNQPTPDPQMHIHAVAASETWDDVEHKWKSLQLQEYGIGKDWSKRPQFQREFHSRLAAKVAQLGYRIKETPFAFEVECVPARLTEKEFSRRTAQVDAKEAELNENLRELTGDPNAKISAKTKAKLGATTREKKEPPIPWPLLQKSWFRRVTAEELQQLQQTFREALENAGKAVMDHAGAVDFALRHLLATRSSVPEKDVVMTALKHGFGTSTPEGVWRELATRPDVIRLPHKDRKTGKTVPMVTTAAMLAAERFVADFGRAGRGSCRPLASAGRLLKNPKLNDDQRKAVQQILSSNDRIILLQGPPGTGKGWGVLSEVREACEETGTKLVAIAPTANASRNVLRADGFDDADTLAHFFDSRELQEKVRGGLLILDEASMASMADTVRLFKLLDQLNARALISGDRKQHKAVQAGEPLMLLQEYAGLRPVMLQKIERQTGEYRRAVEVTYFENDPAKSLQMLDAHGRVQVGDLGQVVDAYLGWLKKGVDAKVIIPTHKAIDAFTAAVRLQLREEGTLGEEHVLPRLAPLNLTEAQRVHAKYYPQGGIVQFHRNTGKHKAGERAEPTAALLDEVKERAGNFAAYQQTAIGLAAGDYIRPTLNLRTKDGKHRVTNGVRYQVEAIEGGDLRLTNGWVLANPQHVAFAYGSTSPSSQGDSRSPVILYLPRESLGAVDATQFLVSLSRGKGGMEAVTLFTDDKEALVKAVQRERHEVSASELIGLPRARERSDKQRRNRRAKILELRQRESKVPDQAHALDRGPSEQRGFGRAL